MVIAMATPTVMGSLIPGTTTTNQSGLRPERGL
jgi:hypothetical protein